MRLSRTPLILLACLLLSATTAHAATLVGYWPFEEKTGLTAFDVSGFNNDGSLTGAARATGKVGLGLTFNGAGGVTIPNSPSLDSLPGGFTMSAWIKPTAFADFASIFFKTNRITREFLHFQTNSKLHIGFNTDPYTWTTASEAIYLNIWQYVAWSYDESFHRLYVNGNTVFNIPFTTPWAGNDESLYIGEHPQIPSAQFVGMIDEARIYRGALTQDEILRDMHSSGVIPEPSVIALLAIGGLMMLFQSNFKRWVSK